MLRRLPLVVMLLLAFLPALAHAGTGGGNDPQGARHGQTVGNAYLLAQANGVTVRGAQFPQLTGRVVDAAGLLSPSQERALIAQLAAFENQSSDQVVVATINSLNGENLEDYANRLFRHWQLGQEGINNGVLLLVSKEDRKLRIEVGYGLEGTLTDALSKVIIETVIVPRFRQGDFGAGISEGTAMILRVLSGDTAELEDRRQRFESNRQSGPDWFGYIFFVVWALLFFGPILFAIGAPIFGRKIGKGRYRWLGIETTYGGSSGYRGGRSGGGWSGGGSSGGGFSGGGGSSGGGGASGGW